MTVWDKRRTARPRLVAAGDPPLYRLARALLASGLRLYGRYDLRGTANLPPSGAAIVVSNHPTDFDPIILGVGFARQLHFMADVVQFRRGFVGRVIPHLGAFAVNKGSADRDGLRTALGLLAAGEVVALFAEGDLYDDGTLHPFQPGVGYLAEASGAPVVPAAITGALGVRDRRWLGRPTVRLDVGEPIVFDATAARGRARWVERAGRIEAAVRELRERGLPAAGRDGTRRPPRRHGGDGPPVRAATDPDRATATFRRAAGPSRRRSSGCRNPDWDRRS
jgi:1-acyl-sn-glycerol-3-phosphate acyltransferase